MRDFDELDARGQIQRLRRCSADVLREYGIPGPELKLLAHHRQTTFRVDSPATGRRYVLRYHRPAYREPAVVQSEFCWLRSLRQSTQIVPEPVATLDGQDVPCVTAPGLPRDLCCSMMKWVEGRRYFRSTGPGARVLRQVGRIMAAMHDHAERFVPPRGFRCPVWDRERLFRELPAGSARAERRLLGATGCRLFREAEQGTGAAMETLGAGRDVFGLIHADLIQSNYLVHCGDVRVIDFADFGYGHFLYDMARKRTTDRLIQRLAGRNAVPLKRDRSEQPMPDLRLLSDRFPRSSQYHPEWVIENGFGANALWLAEWLTSAIDLRPGLRVLDLGCGRAISSIFLALEFDVQVWATDLWISASENIQRIRDAGCEDRVFPMHADARALPFAAGFFDAVLCIDSFNYYGTDSLYLNYLAQFVQPGGPIGIAGAGLVREFGGPVPEHLKPFWTQDCWSLHPAAWWRQLWEPTGLVDIDVADTMPDGWQVWLDWHTTAHPHNTPEIETLQADRGQYLGYIRMVGRRRAEAKLEDYCWPDTMRSFPIKYERQPLLRTHRPDEEEHES